MGIVQRVNSGSFLKHGTFEICIHFVEFPGTKNKNNATFFATDLITTSDSDSIFATFFATDLITTSDSDSE